jgi:hypothetical protein
LTVRLAGPKAKLAIAIALPLLLDAVVGVAVGALLVGVAVGVLLPLALGVEDGLPQAASINTRTMANNENPTGVPAGRRYFCMFLLLTCSSKEGRSVSQAL